MVDSYRKYFQPSDESIPYRLVGSYEYLNALDSFTRLLQISSPEEIKVYDKVLKERPEFTFFNGIHTAFNERPNLANANPFERQKFEDEFQKRGLAWMMALARIELAATGSLYGDVKSSFEKIATTDFDLVPYLTILKDDVLAHMKSLSLEPGFQEVLRRSRKADTWTLAYLRRIKLIRDMLQTLEKVGGPAVQEEIEPLVYELRKHQRDLVEQVMSETAASDIQYSKQKTSFGVNSKTTVGKCRRFVGENFSSSNGSTTSSSPGGGSRIVRTSK